MNTRNTMKVVFLAGAIYSLIEFVPAVRGTAVLIAISSIFISHRESVDKPLLFAVGILGLAPMLGWFGSLNQSVDVVAFLVAFAISSSVSMASRKKIRVDFYAMPAVAAGIITYLWWRPLLSGSRTDLLSRLIGGWDHFGHYYLLISAKVHHKFVALLPDSIPNSTVYNRKYPAGIHMSWAQWWRDMGSGLAKHPTLALHQYFLSVVLTVAICTALIVIAVSRVAEKQWVRTLSSTAVSLLLLAFICFGHLSMAIWSGFPNFIVAITGVIIVSSVAMKPSQSVWVTLLLIAGATAMTTYNWYPLLIPVAPIAIYSLWRESQPLQRTMRHAYFVLGGLLGIAVGLPAIFSLSLGVKHLAIPGGINNLPAQTIVMVLLVGCCIGLIQISKDFSFKSFAQASPLILAGIFQLIVTIPIRLRDGTYPYYPQKIAYGTVFLVITFSLITIIQWLDLKWLGDSVRVRIVQGASLLIACSAFTQMFGYVGADWRNVAGGNTAPGIPTRDVVIANAVSKHRISTILLGLEEATSDESLIHRDCLVLDDTEMQEYDPVLINYWVGTLTWSLTEEHLVRAQGLIPIRTGQVDPLVNAGVLNKLLSTSTDCPVVTRPVASALVDLNPLWAEKIWTIESDGHVTKFVKKD